MPALITRAITRLVGMLIVLALLLVAGGFALVGAYLWLDARVGAVPAAFLIAGSSLALAFLAFLVVSLLDRRRRPASLSARGPMLAALGDAGANLGGDAGAFIRFHPRQTLLAALACGFILGISPRARRWLWRLLG